MLYPRDAPRILLLARENSKLRCEFWGMGIVHQGPGTYFAFHDYTIDGISIMTEISKQILSNMLTYFA